MKAFFHDLFVAYNELSYLPSTLKAEEYNPSDKPFETEFNYISKEIEPPSFWKLLLTTPTPQERIKEFGAYYNGADNHPDKKFFFINGIMTTEELAHVNASALSIIFGTSVDVLYNPTKGLVRDLAECIRGRTFDNYSRPAIEASNQVISALKDHDRVIVIGHSQGGIIASNVANILNDSLSSADKKKIEFYTFAGAQDEFKWPNTSEHFVNGKDYVARVGAYHLKQKHPERIDGMVFADETGEGHMLNAHYLKRFLMRKYCRGNSQLYQYSLKYQEDLKVYAHLKNN